jgi:hypothetical protein
MEQPHRETDRLTTDSAHLAQLVNGGPLEGNRLELALSVAKRVRRTSNILIKALARERDEQLQP